MPEPISNLLRHVSPELLSLVVILIVLSALSRRSVFRGALIIASIILSTRYIFWRGAYTLNTSDYIALTISLVLLLSEFYGFSQYLLFLYQSARVPERKPPPVDEDGLPSVDILITVYNEPAEVLARTIVGCASQDYPEERFVVHVLDDGRREEIRTLCERLNCRYITRPTNKDAKAGNVNNALGLTTGELVAVFDCDHVPVRGFLRETVPYFVDPSVAIVQVPHFFYNPDIFQRNLRLEREITNEQDLFFRVIQPGRDYYNSAFFAGSCGIFRRTALSEIGGIKTETLTEDIHTSMELHSRGYKSVYVNKVLSAGLAPESSSAYLKQRKRWAEGGVQVFILDNPLLKKGLTFHQRLNYFASVSYFFHWFPRIVYLSAPISYLLFSYPPIKTDIWTLLVFFIPHYAGQTLAFNSVSGGNRNPFWSDVYETLMSFGLASVTVKTLMRPRKRHFVVTPKGLRHERGEVRVSEVVPHAGLLSLLITGGLIGAGSLLMGSAEKDVTIISLVWVFYNVIILLAAISSATERPQLRSLIRLPRKVRCELVLPDGPIGCVTTDLSEGGLSLSLDRPVFMNDRIVGLRLTSDYGETTEVKGKVIRADLDPNGRTSVGVRFLDVDTPTYESIVRQMYSSNSSWEEHHLERPVRTTMRSFLLLLTASARSFIKEKLLKRFSPRLPLSFPCEVVLPYAEAAGRTRDISGTGLSAELNGISALPHRVAVDIDLGERKVLLKGEIVWQARKSRGRIIFGMRFMETPEVKELWEELGRLKAA